MLFISVFHCTYMYEIIFFFQRNMYQAFLESVPMLKTLEVRALFIEYGGLSAVLARSVP